MMCCVKIDTLNPSSRLCVAAPADAALKTAKETPTKETPTDENPANEKPTEEIPIEEKPADTQTTSET